MTMLSTTWKVSMFGVCLVRIFPHSDQKNSEFGLFWRSVQDAYMSPYEWVVWTKYKKKKKKKIINDNPHDLHCHLFFQTGEYTATSYLVMGITVFLSGQLADFIRQRGWLTATYARKVFTFVGESFKLLNWFIESNQFIRSWEIFYNILRRLWTSTVLRKIPWLYTLRKLADQIHEIQQIQQS